MSSNKNFYQFQLSFKGDLIENSVDAYDVANTILATSQALHEIAEIKLGKDAVKDLKININAFQKGSLISDFLIFIEQNKELAIPLIPYISNIYNTGKDLLDGLNVIIEIRKMLKGKPAKEIKAIDNRHIKIVGQDDSTTTINYYDFRGLQSKTLIKNINKIVKPLTSEDSLIQNIELFDKDNNKKIIGINKEESIYFKDSQDFQLLEEVRYKGVITKIDTKACSGFMYIGKSRLSFNYDHSLSREKFNILVESLKNKIQIFLIGKVQMDFENNPFHMQILDIESEIKLFD
ncbi:MAG TPA: hypothetical protein PLD14_01410 [Candidatus Pacearchaeota archaeon]|nr:hypothetical protein [Candidatus Pacearchaeota archaeon]HPR79857.1 hypothetical protein [Candidatus Pacearchaeota archaeon]